MYEEADFVMQSRSDSELGRQRSALGRPVGGKVEGTQHQFYVLARGERAVLARIPMAALAATTTLNVAVVQLAEPSLPLSLPMCPAAARLEARIGALEEFP